MTKEGDLMSNQVKDLNINAPSQENFDEVMKKYDRESNVRIWTGKPAIAVKAVYG